MFAVNFALVTSHRRKKLGQNKYVYSTKRNSILPKKYPQKYWPSNRYYFCPDFNNDKQVSKTYIDAIDYVPLPYSTRLHCRAL